MAGYATRIINMLKIGMELNSNFPYDKGDKYRRSPSKPHMRDIALIENQIIAVGDNAYYFEIGNENAQAKAPQYAILENAKVIRRPYKGTNKSKGSQAKIADKGKRDYNVHIWRERTQSKGELFGSFENIQEYRQNIDRNYYGRADKAREQIERMKYHYVYNRNWRPNLHWQYIERILNQLVPQIANDIEATLSISEGDDLGVFNTYTAENYQPNYTFAEQDTSFFTADYDNSPIYDT